MREIMLLYSKLIIDVFSVIMFINLCKVRKRTKNKNRYNQTPHLTQDTNGKVATSQLDITNESQEVSPFPAGDHRASKTGNIVYSNVQYVKYLSKVFSTIHVSHEAIQDTLGEMFLGVYFLIFLCSNLPKLLFILAS